MPVEDVTQLSDDDAKTPTAGGPRPSDDLTPPSIPKKPAKKPTTNDNAEGNLAADEEEKEEAEKSDAELEVPHPKSKSKAKAKASGKSKSKAKASASGKSKPKPSPKSAAPKSSGLKRPAAALKRPAAAAAPVESKKIKASKCFYSRDGVHGIKVGDHEVLRVTRSISCQAPSFQVGPFSLATF